MVVVEHVILEIRVNCHKIVDLFSLAMSSTRIEEAVSGIGDKMYSGQREIS